MICERCGANIKEHDFWLRYDRRLYHENCFNILKSLGLVREPGSFLAEAMDWDELEFDFTDNPDPKPLLDRLKAEIEDLELRRDFNMPGNVSMYLYMNEPQENLIEYPTAPMFGDPLKPGEVHRAPPWQ